MSMQMHRETLEEEFSGEIGYVPDPRPRNRDLIVLDNLYTVAPDPKSWFPFVKQLSESGFRLFVIVLDTSPHDPSDRGAAAKAWEYLADVVINGSPVSGRLHDPYDRDSEGTLPTACLRAASDEDPERDQVRPDCKREGASVS